MTPDEFVNKVRSSLIEESMTMYRGFYENTNPLEAKGNFWPNALNFFNKTEEADEEMVLKIIEHTIVDTLSGVFAILDGVHYLEGQEFDLELLFENDRKKINGNLQDIFLALEEERGEA